MVVLNLQGGPMHIEIFDPKMAVVRSLRHGNGSYGSAAAIGWLSKRVSATSGESTSVWTG